MRNRPGFFAHRIKDALQVEHEFDQDILNKSLTFREQIRMKKI